MPGSLPGRCRDEPPLLGHRAWPRTARSTSGRASRAHTAGCGRRGGPSGSRSCAWSRPPVRATWPCSTGAAQGPFGSPRSVGAASPTATAPTSRCPPSTPGTCRVIAPPDRKISPGSSRSATTSLSTSTSAPTCPELRDVGADFPSPERFDEIGFKHLDLVLVGGGPDAPPPRPGRRGLPPLRCGWTASGRFVKPALLPRRRLPGAASCRSRATSSRCAPPSGSAEARGDVHEMLWWGA